MGIVCKCLAQIANSKRQQESQDYMIDFDRLVNLPKPQAILARLIVIVNAPLRRNQLGINVLNTLQALGPILHPVVWEMWDNAIPKLISYLETNSSNPETWKSSVWEDLILRLLAETIKIANDDEWTIQLGEYLSQQIPLYNSDPELKRVALKLLGLILQKLNHKEFIKSKLEIMLQLTDPNNEAERIG